MEKMKAEKPHGLRIYTDGASRGNPGPGAIAFIIADSKGKVIKEHKEFIGACTNNIAEYKALIAALDAAAKLAGESGEIACFSDSQLMISQMRGEYRVKKGHLKELFEQAKTLERRFKKVEYRSVRRADPDIQRADAMVNEVLDEVARLGKGF